MDNVRDLQIASREEALAYLRGFLDAHRKKRTDYPGSAAACHLLFTGHELRFGCCAAGGKLLEEANTHWHDHAA